MATYFLSCERWQVLYSSEAQWQDLFTCVSFSENICSNIQLHGAPQGPVESFLLLMYSTVQNRVFIARTCIYCSEYIKFGDIYWTPSSVCYSSLVNMSPNGNAMMLSWVQTQAAEMKSCFREFLSLLSGRLMKMRCSGPLACNAHRWTDGSHLDKQRKTDRLCRFTQRQSGDRLSPCILMPAQPHWPTFDWIVTQWEKAGYFSCSSINQCSRLQLSQLCLSVN